MDMSNDSFQYVTYIRATPGRVWEALTSAELMKAYFFNLPFEAELKEGGSWRRNFPDGTPMTEGRFLEFVPPSRLVLSWLNLDPEKKAEGFSRCAFELEKQGDATKLTVTHTSEVAGSKLIAAVASAWPQVLSNMKSFLETGTVALAMPVR
jgi:uncharacterized protein YndB with AHSA1/START domain